MICKNCATVFLLQILFQVLLLDISFVTYCLFYNLKKKKKGVEITCVHLSSGLEYFDFALGGCSLRQPWQPKCGFQCSECNFHLMTDTCWTMSLKLFSPHSPRLPLYLASLFISLLFLLVNLTCAVLVRTQNSERKVIVSVRVAINDTLFVLCAVSLSICLYKISKMSLANIYLESKVRYIFSSF